MFQQLVRMLSAVKINMFAKLCKYSVKLTQTKDTKSDILTLTVSDIDAHTY